jgi:hypothetical protein
MADTFKPLFNRNLLAQKLAHFQPVLTPLKRQVAGEWAATASDPSFRSIKEKPLQGLFLSKVFDSLLGYWQVVGHSDAYYMKAETASKEIKGGKTPDARLGLFGPETDVTRAVVELKAPGADLDGKQTGYGGQIVSSRAEHGEKLLEKAQKMLDRVLFTCFCEDKGLLPHGVIRQALEAAGAGFVRTTRWQQLTGLFEAINTGRPALKINAYNGGLFARDQELDALIVSDEVLDDCLRLSGYDFETDLNVNILGRIFEQSIPDLEAIRAEIKGETASKKESKRKKEGVFYTPEFVTRYVVESSIGRWLEECFAGLEKKYDLESVRGSNKRKEAEENLWLDYQEALRNIKVLDPACGSSAFLVAAFDYLHAEYERVNRKLAELRGGQISLFDLDPARYFKRTSTAWT